MPSRSAPAARKPLKKPALRGYNAAERNHVPASPSARRAQHPRAMQPPEHPKARASLCFAAPLLAPDRPGSLFSQVSESKPSREVVESFDSLREHRPSPFGLAASRAVQNCAELCRATGWLSAAVPSEPWPGAATPKLGAPRFELTLPASMPRRSAACSRAAPRLRKVLRELCPAPPAADDPGSVLHRPGSSGQSPSRR